MNIIYIPGGREASAPEKADMGEYIRRGTEIDMASHKIVNCAAGTDDDDVVTLRGLSAYYRKGAVLEMNQRQIKSLADATEPDDAVTLRQARSLLSPKTKTGIIARNRFGATILLKCNRVIPLALYIRTRDGVYVQEPLSIFDRSEAARPSGDRTDRLVTIPLTAEDRLTPTFVLFITRELTFEGRPYKLHYLVNEDNFIESEPTEEERATLDPFNLRAPVRNDA